MGFGSEPRWIGQKAKSLQRPRSMDKMETETENKHHGDLPSIIGRAKLDVDSLVNPENENIL